jgi:predicted nuclease of predicted toxin-antitoxin system
MASDFKFIVDTQLPPVLASFLQRKGFDAIHTTSFFEGYLLEDEQINQIAVEQNRIIITKDSDFSEHYFLKGPPPRALHLSVGNIRNRDLVDWFDSVMMLIVSSFETGSEMIEINLKEMISY